MRRLPLLLVAVLAAAGLAGCGGGGDRLVVYSGRTSNLITPLLKTFSEETGIKVDVRYGDSAELAQLIAEEGDQSPADLFISQSPGAVGFLDAKGRLAELEPATLGLVGDEYRSPTGHWIGLTGRVRTLVYNTDDVSPADLPPSVLDLLDPAFKGKVALAPSNGSFQDFVSALSVLAGEQQAQAWLDGMADNGAATYANNTAIVEAVARGEVPMGLVNHYYIARAKAEDPKAPIATHEFAVKDPGNLFLVTAAGILDSAGQVADAHRLLDFLLAEEAQTFFAEETFEYPLAAGVDPAAGVTPLANVAVTTFDLGRLGGDLAATIEMIDKSGLSG